MVSVLASNPPDTIRLEIAQAAAIDAKIGPPDGANTFPLVSRDARVHLNLDGALFGRILMVKVVHGSAKWLMATVPVALSFGFEDLARLLPIVYWQ